MVKNFFFGTNRALQYFTASLPDTLMTAIPPVPGAVDMAVMVLYFMLLF
jgi:hypothetical protein